jgi:hypothetical protein
MLKMEENEFVVKKKIESHSSPTPPPPPPLTEGTTKKLHSNLILADTLHIVRTEFYTLDQNKKLPFSNL